MFMKPHRFRDLAEVQPSGTAMRFLEVVRSRSDLEINNYSSPAINDRQAWQNRSAVLRNTVDGQSIVSLNGLSPFITFFK